MQQFKAAGGASVNACNYFESISIDSEQFETKIYIVQETDILTEMVIGNELLFSGEVDLSIKNGNLLIKRSEESKQIPIEEKRIMCMLIEKDERFEKAPQEVK